MNRIRKYAVSTIVVVLTTLQFAYSQTGQQVLSECSNAFSKYENLSMEVAVSNYATPTAPAVLLGTAVMHKSKDGYYSKFLSDEMISNNTCTVVMNHDGRLMYCFTGEKNKRSKNQNVMVSDSMAATGDSIHYAGLIDNMKCVIIYHRNSYYSKTELYISPATSLPSRIVYYHVPANDDFTTDVYKTELLYNKISFEKPDASFFDESKYVVKKNGIWQTTPEYRNYKFNTSQSPSR